MDCSKLCRPGSIDCRDAADLLSKLDPSSELWAPFEYGRWAFRGQANALWDLTPRAFRAGERLSFHDTALRAPLDGQAQIGAEWKLLADFIEFADELGFRLPGDLSVFRFPWAEHERPVFLDRSWPWIEVLEVAAIAQHHGVPTRLLDFTFNPLVAAYLAAADVCAGSDRLAVWALDVSFIRGAWAAFDSGVRVVQVSRGSNPFLHAQSGLFVYDAQDSREPVQSRILGHDLAAVAHIDAARKKYLALSPRVRLITLSSRERSRLLEDLAARRITRAHLQPTLDNVTRELWMKGDEAPAGQGARNTAMEPSAPDL